MGKKTDYRELMQQALMARRMAYAPYSNFAVGAALEAADGTVYQGCNIENAAFGPGSCAERTAFVKAVSEGQRNFRAIAIVGGPVGISEERLSPCPPCGVCRQVMREFCEPESFEIITGSSPEEYQVYRLEELFPLGFGPENLG